MTEVRPPAVAGTFYPDSRVGLSRQVAGLLDAAAVPSDAPVPKALVVPHAGYIYSGAIAATAYARIAPARDRVKRVVLLGPAHRVAIDGLALPGALGFASPLGVVPLDREGVRQVSSLSQVIESRTAHAHEHSLEVHLPFLQTTLGGFGLVPLLVGRASANAVAQVLERLWGGDETLVVISSDLSHYLRYEQAQLVDRETVDAILSCRGVLTHDQACGATPVNGLLTVAARRGLKSEMLDLRNSGDTAGDRSRVVGYAAIAFFEASQMQRQAPTNVADQQGPVLLGLARAAIADILGLPVAAEDRHPFLRANGACFITLTREGKLRGCVGSLEARRALLEDVKANAKAAAFLDPRFPPLTQTEFATTRIEISILSVPEPLDFADERDARARIRPGIDGVILEHGDKRATFLPQVWESIPDPAEFLRQLKVKAGLEPAFWADDLRLQRYTVTKFREAGASDQQHD